MAEKRVSYRNPFSSTLIYAILYLVISNVFYWVFNGRLSFVPFHYYEWLEYALGTIVMAFCVLAAELVRNLAGQKAQE